jgi:hypothetical protein
LILIFSREIVLGEGDPNAITEEDAHPVTAHPSADGGSDGGAHVEGNGEVAPSEHPGDDPVHLEMDLARLAVGGA